MKNRRILSAILAMSTSLALVCSVRDAHAGFGDSLKKKLGDQAAKAKAAVDQTARKPEPAPAAGTAEPANAEASGASASSSTKVSAVSTKFDFVPGDSVMFFDDMTLDDLGEFPAHWRLSQGTFEVAELDGERWLRCMSPDGRVRMKVPGLATLPEFWTLEFDVMGREPMASAFTVRGLAAGDRTAWEAVFPNGSDLAFRTGEIYSTTTLEGDQGMTGRHHMMFMASGVGAQGVHRPPAPGERARDFQRGGPARRARVPPVGALPPDDHERALRTGLPPGEGHARRGQARHLRDPLRHRL